MFYGDGHRVRMATDAQALGKMVPQDSMWAWAFKALAALNDRPWATYRTGVREGWNDVQAMKEAECTSGTFSAALWMGKALVRLACRYEVIELDDVPVTVRTECEVSADDIVAADPPAEDADAADPPTPRNKEGKRSLVGTQSAAVKKRKIGSKPAAAAAADGPGLGQGVAAAVPAGAGHGPNGAGQPSPAAAASGAEHAAGGAAADMTASGGQATASALLTPGVHARVGHGAGQGSIRRQVSGSPWPKVTPTGGGKRTPQGGLMSQWSCEAPDGKSPPPQAML